MHAVVGHKEQRVAHRHERVGARVVRKRSSAGVDVFDQDGAAACAITFPQFSAMHTVVSHKEQRVAHRCERVGPNALD
jgi:hypothetical protein